MQIGRAIDASGEFPEALFRQALYFVALEPTAEALAMTLSGQIKRAYGLDGVLETTDVTAQGASPIPESVASN